MGIFQWQSWIVFMVSLNALRFVFGRSKDDGLFWSYYYNYYNYLYLYLPSDHPVHSHGQLERANWAEMHDVLVERRTALHHLVQGRKSDGGQSAEGCPKARVSEPSWLRHVSVSGAQGRRGDGTERGHRTLGRWVNQFTVFLVARDCFWKKKNRIYRPDTHSILENSV